MSILLLLLGGALFACMVVFWKNPSQINIDAMSTNSTSLATPSSLTGPTKSNSSKSLTVNSISQDIVINYPHSIIMQVKILAILSILEYQLAELEHVVVTKGLKPVLCKHKPT